MKKLFHNSVILELALIFFLSLTPLLWFKPGTILVGHDNTYPLVPKIFLENRLFTWTENFFGHDQSFILGTIPIHFIDAIPSLVGFSLQSGQKIVYVFWFFWIGLSAYILGWVLRPQSRLFRLTAVIIYQFNYFILQGWWIGEKSKFSAYIALALLLSVVFLVSRRRMSTLIGAITASLILFIFNGGGVYGIPLFGGAFIAIGMLILLKSLAYILVRDFHSFYRLMIFCALTLALSVLMNSYFIVPAYAKAHLGAAPDVSSVGGVTGIISWAKQISANASYLNLFRLQGIPEWYDNPEHPFAKQILERKVFIAISFFWTLLVFLSFFFTKKDKKGKIITYFFVVYLIGIFFSAGTHSPLGFLYKFFIEKIPGFILFRSPYYKFASAIFLSSTYLISYFIDNLPKRIRVFSFVLFLLAIAIYHYPYFTGDFFAWRNIFSTRLTIPSYVYEFGIWLNREKIDDGRVLMLPPNNPNLHYSTYRWGYLSFQSLPTLLSSKSTVINNDQINPTEETMLDSLYKAIERKDSARIKILMSILHISYVLLQNDAISDTKSDIQVNVQTYAKALGDNSQFFLLRSFGEWNLFAFKAPLLPKFYVIENMLAVSGDNKDVDSFLGFTGEATAFFNEEDLKKSHMSRIPELIMPSCLTCPLKEHLDIVFPDRSISPNDPFYQFFLFLENRWPLPKEPKAAIYHLLGSSLKRLSEIRNMAVYQKTVSEDMVKLYASLLQAIYQNFQKLSTLQEKISVARDIRIYMRAERKFLGPSLGENIPSGKQTILSGMIFSAMKDLENQTALPELQLDELGNRVYQFSTENEENFELFLRSADFQNLKDEVNLFSIRIDDNLKKELTITSATLTQSWFSFGLMKIPSGSHTLIISFPSILKVVQALSPIDTEFSHDNAICFGTHINNIQSPKLYKLYVSYLNDFSNNLVLYIWDQNGSTRKLKNAVILPSTSLSETTEQIIEPSEGTSEELVAICSSDLTEEKVQKRIQMSVSEILIPSVVFYSQERAEHDLIPIPVVKLNSTRYKFYPVNKAIKPNVLVFLERYDDWWELTGVKSQHIQVDGYANGWIIEGTPPGKLEIRYKGEQYFFYGKLISLFTVLGGLAYLSLNFFLKRHHD